MNYHEQVKSDPLHYQHNETPTNMNHEDILAKHSPNYAGYLKMHEGFATHAKAQVNHKEALAAMAEAVEAAKVNWDEDKHKLLLSISNLHERHDAELAAKDKELAEYKEAFATLVNINPITRNNILNLLKKIKQQQ